MNNANKYFPVFETTVASVMTGGVSTGYGGAVGNTDFYATGDARNIWGEGGKKGKKKKKPGFKVFRRSFVTEHVDSNTAECVVDWSKITSEELQLLEKLVDKHQSRLYNGCIVGNCQDIQSLYETYSMYSDCLKKPKKRLDEYSPTDVRNGTAYEGRLERSPIIAARKARIRLDSDKDYYNKLIKSGVNVNGQRKQKQR